MNGLDLDVIFCPRSRQKNDACALPANADQMGAPDREALESLETSYAPMENQQFAVPVGFDRKVVRSGQESIVHADLGDRDLEISLRPWSLMS